MTPIDHAVYRMSNDAFAIGVPTGILRRLLMIGLREVEEQELRAWAEGELRKLAERTEP